MPERTKTQMQGMAPLNSIQLLRFFAAFMVVAFHCFKLPEAQLGALRDPVLQITGIGAAGVHIFFVISGFVIVYSAGPLFGHLGNVPVFLRRRAIRIYPVYWIVGLINLPLLALIGWRLPEGWMEFAGALALWPTYNADLLFLGWTLSYEILFYLLFASVLWLPRGMAIMLLSVGLFGLVAAGRIFGTAGPGTVSFVVTNPLLLEFAFGMWIAGVHLAGWRLPQWLAQCCVALGLGGFGFTLGLDRETLPSLVYWGVSSAFLVAGLVGIEAAGRGTVFFRRFTKLGDASYSLYLLHALILPVALVFVFGTVKTVPLIPLTYLILFALLATPVCVWVSLVFHRRVEATLLRLLNRFFSDRPSGAESERTFSQLKR